jgi:hypothetical protein
MTNVVCAMCNAFSLFPSKMILWREVHVLTHVSNACLESTTFLSLLEKHLLSLIVSIVVSNVSSIQFEG